MLTRTSLQALEHSLRDQRVLSVYLDGTAPDPAERLRWRRELEPSLREARRQIVGASHEEREDFEQAVKFLEEALLPITGALRSAGWVGFMTAAGVRHAEALPVSFDTEVSWGMGAVIAPYVRALNVTTPIVAVLTDTVRVEIARCDDGVWTTLEVLEAATEVELGTHMGDSPRQGFHTGTRGSTATDAAQRSLHDAAEQLQHDAERRVTALMPPDGWLVVGGNSIHARQLLERLPKAIVRRARAEPSLVMHSSPAERVAAVAVAVAALRNASSLEKVSIIENEAASGGRGALGRGDTARALAGGQVHELLVTTRFAKEHPVEMRAAVGDAFEQGADVLEVSGSAADRLEAHEGIAAHLRLALGPAATESQSDSALEFSRK